MYTVLIVDDETLVRRGVASMIDWASLGFTTVFEAEDGMDALEICRNNKVDLVLTDIVMPFMDGLELSGILGQEFPDIQIVILTGHEDFEYAKQSVDLGVKNYILKPVGANTLYEKMQEICKRLYVETSQKKYIAKMKSQLHRSMPVLQEKFLYSLVCTEHIMRSDIKERIKTLELPLHSKTYAVSIVEMDLSQIDKSDMELYIFTAKNIIQDCVGKGHCVFDDNNKVIIVFNLEYYEEEPHETFYRTLQVVQKAVYSTLKVNNTCAIGSIVGSVYELNTSWKEANTALDCKYSLGVNRVYDINDLDYIEKSFYYPSEEIKKLIYTIKFMTMSDIELAVEAVCAILSKSQNLSSSNIKMIFIEILTNLLKELSGVKQVKSEIWNEGFSLYNELEQINSIEQIKEKLLNYSNKVAIQLHQSQQNSGEIIIQNTKAFMEKNYTDESITLSKAAEEVSISMGYLSALFKKETGENFTEYLTNIRMEKAMELLRTTDQKAYEIAYAIGFSNPHYFSICFKKYSGLSPSEYRNAK